MRTTSDMQYFGFTCKYLLNVRGSLRTPMKILLWHILCHENDHSKDEKLHEFILLSLELLTTVVRTIVFNLIIDNSNRPEIKINHISIITLIQLQVFSPSASHDVHSQKPLGNSHYHPLSPLPLTTIVGWKGSRHDHSHTTDSPIPQTPQTTYYPIY